MKKGKGRNSKLLPSSLRIISSCIKTVSTNASTVVRSAGASVAVSISASADDRKEQVLCASFDKLELCPKSVRRVLLLGYQNGFQVFDVEDSARLCELVSRREGPVTFLQVLPTPENFDGAEKCKISPPMLAVVGGDKAESNPQCGNIAQGPVRDGSVESSFGSSIEPPTVVRLYSLKLNEYVKVFDFKSAVFMVRCSHRAIAVGLQEQIYCFDSLTLEKKFIVVTYPVPRFGEQGAVGIITGYGPMAVGPRWLAYSPNRPFILNTGRLIPKNLNTNATPSASPGSGSMMARYAMESSKHLASGILTLGDMGYKKLSKYCPELLPPDSPSPPGWKAGCLAACEPENAGVVVVKDLVSSEVVSQFRAHMSPISALCFDPSGTLLVTASVHGNHINIFRTMPSHSSSGSGSSDWSTTSVHLYKLHRGITTAVIQDICFSNYSQWVAIVSSKGTCHIFVLSPFGGDDGFQALKTPGQGVSLVFTSSPPWWSTSSFTTSEQNSMPPPTCTLSVVSRIKCRDTGLLNSVSNAAASAVGKVLVPSGAVAAIFHNLNSSGSLNVPSTASSLEYILVCTPSGFVVQHEIWPAIGSALSERKTESSPQVNPQNEEFAVKAEPVQWWDVCRRMDNMEREECISGSIFYGQGDHEIHESNRTNSQEIFNARSKNVLQSNPLRPPQRSHLHLSNAEVQISSCRLPIWQNSKIQFHVIQVPRKECFLDGEFEIEMASSCEVEIRHKDLLPIVDNFARVRSGWIERSMPSERRCPYTLPSDGTQAGERTNEASIMYHSKPPSFSSTESSEGGSSRQIECLLDLDHMNIDRSPINISRSANTLDMEREEMTSIKASLMDPRSVHNSADFVVGNTSLSGSSSSANEYSSSDVSSDSAAEILMPSGTEKEVDFGQFFKEGYCDMPNLHDRGHSTEVSAIEVETCSNAQIEGSSLEEGWIGDMFELEGN
ncbi:autophagy-related protein 18g [Dorcoceras hygrometricum]|uniref:Autophagy-related protein 18g n=1 Tax=Dorcoceras hygrometricum TaxID=472368 RepID=A0A2Z7BA53_9LAMI|nr:autophagy-related protein 18g [Dorcoceras hygrometricum]